MSEPATGNGLKPSEDQPPDQGPAPPNSLRRQVVWLLAIVAPAGWFVGLAAVRFLAGPPNYAIDVGMPSMIGTMGMLALGVLPVLICLLAVWAALSYGRLTASLLRGAAQLGAVYLSVMALMLSDESALWTMPWAVALGVSLFAAPPLVVSLVLRWFRWRLVRRRGAMALPPLPPRYQFRLADVFAWMTLLAVFLGLGTVILSRFDKEPSGWDGLGPLFIWFISLVLCGPTGILSVVFTWLVLAERRRRARAIVAVCLQLIWVGSILYVLAGLGMRPFQFNPDAYSTLSTPPALGLPALLLLGMARLAGWRMVRLPKS